MCVAILYIRCNHCTIFQVKRIHEIYSISLTSDFWCWHGATLEVTSRVCKGSIMSENVMPQCGAPMWCPNVMPCANIHGVPERLDVSVAFKSLCNEFFSPIIFVATCLYLHDKLQLWPRTLSSFEIESIDWLLWLAFEHAQKTNCKKNSSTGQF